MWDEQSALLSDTNQHKDLIQESLVAENYIATHYVSKIKSCSLKSSYFTKFKATNTLAKHLNEQMNRLQKLSLK